MPRRFKAEYLIRRIRSQCDSEDGDMVSDLDITDRLTSALAELYSIVGHRQERQYFTGSDMTAATADDEDEFGAYIALPPDHLMTIGVDRKISSWEPLREITTGERNDYWNGGGVADAWELRNDRIYIYNAPASGDKLRHVYTPQSPVVPDDNDQYEIDVFVPDGEQFLIWSSVAELKDKTDEDYRFASRRAAKFEERVRIWAVKRAPHHVRRRDVYDEYYDRSARRRWGGEYDY